MPEFTYLTTSPTLSIKLAGRRWQSVGGILTLSDAAAAELDALLTSSDRSDIRAQVKKVDMEAAAKRARDYVEEQRRHPAATRGVVTSTSQASALLRDAKRAQETTILTGVENPINTDSQRKASRGVLDVTQMETAPPKPGSLASRVQKS